jgi:hypothetical protein
VASKEPSIKTKRRLKALEEVAGLLGDLSPEEFEAFLEATKRRPLFGNNKAGNHQGEVCLP